MLRNNRVLFYRGAAFQDLSVALSNIHSQTKVLNFQTPGDYLYLGSDFPFNHRYFDVSVVNAIDSTVSVDIWSGSGWKAAVDVIDETQSTSGKSLSGSGVISWQIDLDEPSWSYDDTDEMTASGLTTAPKIYQLYWARLSWSASLTGTTALNYIGHRFSYDEALEAEYPELASSNVKTAWKSGKTDWKEQTLQAAEYIVQDLRGIKNLITSPSQILDWRQFEKASIHKTAEIIFRGFGDDYTDQLVNAMKSYKSTLSVGKFNIDQDRDGHLSDAEKTTNLGYMRR